ncbi:MAG TPA: NAD-binding protein [Anaerolineales bacterium]|nr:NAD-binding protein [Anaerolineales bacterium]
MSDTTQQHIIIVGCGRLGAELARSLAQKKHAVAVIDFSERAFDRLGPDFLGRTVQGEAVDEDVLHRAGIKKAHAFAAVTSSDSVNIITARVARDLYHVEHVVARIFNPRKTLIYEMLGLQTVATSSWGAQRFEQLLLIPGMRNIGTAGNGEVQLYELTIAEEWAGRPITELVPAEFAIPTALTRGGKASLPEQGAVLQADDILQISATSEGVAIIRKRLKANGGRP